MLRKKENENPFSKNQPAVHLDRFRCSALAGSVQEFPEHFTKGAHCIPPSPTVSSKPESNVKPRGFDASLSTHGSTSQQLSDGQYQDCAHARKQIAGRISSCLD
ncbi:MAG: hypothetical protein DMF02_09685 [Verrucomicrobia bacterium]|nr:MAG: hypothetical protein DMF02_09685 [Verrucomicrobiota bacterium]